MSHVNVTLNATTTRLKRSSSESSSRSASTCGSPLAPPLPVAPPPLPPPPPLPRGAEAIEPPGGVSASQSYSSHKQDKDRNNASANANLNGPGFNVSLAMQNVLARDIMSLAQRMKVAQQLDAHLRQMSWTPSLLSSYEPFLQPLLDLLNANNTKAAKELQHSVMTILQLIGSHNPRKALEWINQHVQLHNELLCLEWSFGLLMEAERRVPTVGADSDNTTTTTSTTPTCKSNERKWSERTMEYLEFDAAMGRAFQLWRAILDRTAEERCVDKITSFLMAFASQLGDPLGALMQKRIQPHFVDIADVLIGWAMNSMASSELRENIIRLLENLGPLWSDNSVFSLQLLESFSDDIKTLCESHPLNPDEHVKMNTLVVCFLMLVHCVPHLVLDGSSQPSSLLRRVLDCVVACNHSAFTMYCVSKSAVYLTSIHQLPSSPCWTTTSFLAVEFLLLKMTALTTRHDTSLTDLCLVLVEVKKLLVTNPPNDHTARKSICLLSEPIVLGNRRHKKMIFETLLLVQCGSFTRALVGVATMLIRLGGNAGMKAVFKNALDAPRNGSRGWSESFDFWLLCMTISIENLGKDQTESLTSSALEESLVFFLQSSMTAGSAAVSPRQIARIMKVLCKLVRQQSVPAPKSSRIKSESVTGLMEFTLQTLPVQSANPLAASLVVLPCLELLEAFVQSNFVATEHLEAFVSKLCKKLSNLVRSPYGDLRDTCLRLLSRLVTRYGHFRVIVPVLDMTLDQMWDKSITQTTLDAISKASTASVLLRMPKRHPLHVNYSSLSRKFTSADFERVVQLLGDFDTDLPKSLQVCESIWNRIADRSLSAPASNIPNVLPPRHSWKILNVVRQAAMWCVSSRLRTHFGGAAQTFGSIERLLRKLAIGSNWMPWTQPQGAISRYLTVFFAGMLEFQIFLVTNGGAATCLETNKSTEEVNKATIGFFKTNKKVCDDWLLRIRPLLVEIAKSTTPDLLCYHANELFFSLHRKLTRIVNSDAISSEKPEAIRELHDVESELDSSLFALCVAYADLKDSDSIRSLQTISNSLMEYVKKRTGFSQQRQDFLTWTEALLCEANLRFEDAAALYENLLDPILISRDSSDFYLADLPQILCGSLEVLAIRVPDLIRRCAHCYLTTRNWTAMGELMRKLIVTMDGFGAASHTNEICQELANCADAWRREMDMVATLEALEISGDDSPDVQIPANDATEMLGKWQLIDETERKSFENKSPFGDSDLLNSSSNYLRVLALDPRLFSPCAGENVAVSVEEALLRVACAGTKDPTGLEMTAVFNRNLIKQKPSTHSIKQFSRLCLSGTELKNELEHRFVLETARAARKQRNFDLSDRLLDLVERKSSATLRYWTLFERACLLEQQGQVADGYSMLWQLCHEEFRRCDGHEMSCTNNLREKLCEPIGEASILYGKCLLRISQGLAKSRVDSRDIQELHGYVETMIKPQCKPNELKNHSDNDLIMGRMLHVASLILPTDSKAWLRYGNWCYQQAKREIEFVGRSGGFVDLDESERDQVDHLFARVEIAPEKASVLMRELSLLLDDGSMVPERRAALEKICMELLPDAHHQDFRQDLLKLFDGLRSRVFHYHRLAARVYGNFLQVASSSSFSASLTSQCLVVSLRLLRLLVKFGSEPVLATRLRELFATSPISPWCRIVPQLFAHISHPNGSVSSVVCMILRRIAHHSPHLVVYPAVVNTLSRSPVPDSTRSFEYLQMDEVHRELGETSRAFVNEIEVFVAELKRISVLWDEAWAMGLVKVSSDVSRRLNTLEQEASRVAKNSTLSEKDKITLGKRKFVAIMRPVLVSLEKLWNETGARASTQAHLTPHERAFLSEYGDQICSGLAQFRQYCALDAASSVMLDEKVDVASLPQIVWGPFVEIMNRITAVVSRRDQIPIQDISPSIGNISNQPTVINMPGALVKSSAREGGFEPVLIRNADSKVMVLRTKTKPKTLEFMGSDGRRYRFLLKAREDLHLDERIMQFLKTVNDFLRADKQAASRNLNALNYNVTPLSNDAGMIQMVPDVIPLFQVYTNWSEAGRSRFGPNAGAVNPPTTAFYAKLEHYGIANASPMHRGHLPVALLKRVYKELAGQLPRHILRNEMMLRSSDMQEHWSKMCSFSRSVAVMSVLGYIIGLGDRHLDNILLCKKSGEIVHIDYNICFEKGLKLKVPEIVPFRLTPMLQDALGIEGFEEGSKFRIALENTLRVVRSVDSCETLLTLLEAFVYDPLIDWKKEEEGTGAATLRSRLDANVNLSLFLSRAEERRQATSDFEKKFATLMTSFWDQLLVLREVFVPVLSQSVTLETLYQRKNFLKGRVDESSKRVASLMYAGEAQRGVLYTSNHQLQELTSKIESFVEECKTRNDQIVHWRDRWLAIQQDHSLFTGVHSFESLRRQFVALAERCGGMVAMTLRNSFLELQHRCLSVDAEISIFVDQFKQLSNQVMPLLHLYASIRERVDEYLSLGTGYVENAYTGWTQWCSEFLQSVQRADVPQAEWHLNHISSAMKPSAAAESGVTGAMDSGMWNVYDQVKQLMQQQKQSVDHAHSQLRRLRESLEMSIDREIQHLVGALTNMKLSNAQSQRLMKLAGVLALIETYNRMGGPLDQEMMVADVQMPPLTTSIQTNLDATAVLVDLVSIPKGSLKHMHAKEIVAHLDQCSSQRPDGARKGSLVLRALQEVMQSLQVVAEVTLVDRACKTLLEVPDRQELYPLQRLVELLQHETMRLDFDVQGFFECIRLVREGTGEESWTREQGLQQNLMPLLSKCRPAAQYFASIEKLSQSTGELYQVLGKSWNEVEDATRQVSIQWIQVITNVFSILLGDDTVKNLRVAHGEALAFMNNAIEAFVTTHVVPHFGTSVAEIVEHDWKFSLGNVEAAFAVESRAWDELYLKELVKILPASHLSGDNGVNPRDDQVVNALSRVMQQFSQLVLVERQQASVKKSQLVMEEFFRMIHCRTVLTEWTQDQQFVESAIQCAPESDRMIVGNRTDLLHLLQSFVQQVGHLVMQIQPWESHVLELAQQMEYLAVQMVTCGEFGHMMEPNPSEQVQGCYASASQFFDLIRQVAMALKRVHTIEHSRRDLVTQTSERHLVEFDSVGEALLSSAFRCLVDFAQQQATVNLSQEEVSKAQMDLNQAKAALDELQAEIESQEWSLMAMQTVENLQVVEQVMAKANELVGFFKCFEKTRVGSQSGAHVTGRQHQLAQQQQQQSKAKAKASKPQWEHSDGFSFSENERLVKILLHNIKSASFLGELTDVLKSHEIKASAAQQLIGSLSTSLLKFIQQESCLGQLLSTMEPRESCSRQTASFLQATQASLRLATDQVESNSATTAGNTTGLFMSILQNVREFFQELKVEPLASGFQDDCDDALPRRAQRLVDECLQLFFKATLMASEFSRENEAMEQVDARGGESGGNGEDDETCNGLANEEQSNAFDADEADEAAIEIGGSAGGVPGTGAAVAVAPAPAPAAASIATAGGGGGGIQKQQKNRYGLQILRRVQEKLDGKVFAHEKSGSCSTALRAHPYVATTASGLSSFQVLSVPQQADWLIQEATKLDNLCVMYEGWTPWI